MNGIIINGKVYTPEIRLDGNQCTHCDLGNDEDNICDECFSDVEQSYPCQMFAPCNKVFFRFSERLTDKLNNS